MRQMMRIFLENAVKYTPAGGHIAVSSRRLPEKGCMELTFADDGIGIAQEDKDKIFERFYRADSARTKKAGSTASLTANQIVTNVIKVKAAGSTTTTISDKAAKSKAAAAAANAAYTNAASAIGEPDLTQTAGAMFGPYVPEGAYTNQIAPVIDYTMINVPGPDGQISDGNAQDW